VGSAGGGSAWAIEEQRHEAKLRGRERVLLARQLDWILGIHAAEAGQHDEAAAYFARATHYPAARADAYGGWGNTLLEASRPEEAIAKYRLALECDPHDARTHGNLGLALMLAGRPDEAADALEASLELDPAWDKTWLTLGILHSKENRLDEAARCLKRAVELKADSPVAFTRYGDVLARIGRHDEAARQYRAALALQPAGVAAARGLAMALYEQGRYGDALDACRTGLAQAGDDPALLTAQAWILATCPDDRIRDGPTALRLARRAMEAGATDAYAFDALAAASAEVGYFESAVKFAQQALERARQHADQSLAAAIEQRLALYQEHKPYRPAP